MDAFKSVMFTRCGLKTREAMSKSLGIYAKADAKEKGKHGYHVAP
jgi:hypothetical protein